MREPEPEMLFGWGRANHARSLVYRPTTPEQARRALRDARERALTVCHRGAGQSYGDAALNQGGAVVETTGLDRILDYDPEQGVIELEAGVTIDRLWRHVISDGWWPPVVPGTSRPTVGGCVAMNVHGKNHVQAGSFGEHVRRMTVMGPDATVEELERGDPGFRRTVGAQGTNGTILSAEVELAEIASGYLAVEARTAPSLTEAMAVLDDLTSRHDYSVGWIDCFGSGSKLGRTELHGASYLPEDHERAGAGLTVQAQEPSPRILGLLPRRHVSSLLGWVANDPGMRALNAGKYLHARATHPSRYLQPHAGFHFLLDYVPDWKRAYGRGGLVQYQFFVPADKAEPVFTEALRRQHDRRITSYLGVLKRHRSDPFPSDYSVDGYSLALDFPVRERGLSDLMELVADFDELQEAAGGKVYAAKDAVSRIGRHPAADGRNSLYSSNLVRRWQQSGSTERSHSRNHG